MKKLITIFCFLVLQINLYGQDTNYIKIKNLEIDPGHESINSIVKLDEGHVLLTSTGMATPNAGYWIMINRSLDVDKMQVNWKKYYTPEEPFGLSPHDIIRNKDGNFVIVGSIRIDNFFTLNKDAGNGYICEMTPEGEILWFNTIGEEPEKDWGVGVAQIEDGGYAMAGWKYQNKFSVKTDGLLRRTNEKGDSLWTLHFPVDTSTIYGKNKGVDVEYGNNNTIFFLYTKSSNSYAKRIFCIAKVNGDTGAIIWDKDFDFGLTSNVYRISSTKNGNLRVTGDIREQNVGGCHTPSVWVISQNGEVLFEKEYLEELGCSFGTDFTSTKDGGFIFGKAGSPSSRLVKLDKNYEIEWIKSYNVAGSTKGVVEMANGDFILAGYYGGSEYTIWALRIDNTGETVSISYPDYSKIDLSIFPNPTQDQITIKSKDLLENNLEIQVVNTVGEQVLTVKNKKSFSLKSLSTGTYFLRIFSDNELVAVKKLVKN